MGGLDTQRYLYESGKTRQDLSAVALMSRRHAASNPWAVYQQPLSLEDYMAAPMISDPLCLLDCDVPVDGSTSIIVSRSDIGTNHGRSLLIIDALGSGLSMESCAATMWERSRLTPSDVDVAQLYDGFSVFVPQWLEALGLCPPEQGLDLIGDGDAVDPSGILPLNTGGGQLSGGRLHGFGHLYEACQQLWGRCPGRQVHDAEVAVVSTGSYWFVGSALLRVI